MAAFGEPAQMTETISPILYANPLGDALAGRASRYGDGGGSAGDSEWNRRGVMDVEPEPPKPGGPGLGGLEPGAQRPVSPIYATADETLRAPNSGGAGPEVYDNVINGGAPDLATLPMYDLAESNGGQSLRPAGDAGIDVAGLAATAAAMHPNAGLGGTAGYLQVAAAPAGTIAL
jgi:hypothetical protein